MNKAKHKHQHLRGFIHKRVNFFRNCFEKGKLENTTRLYLTHLRIDICMKRYKFITKCIYFSDVIKIMQFIYKLSQNPMNESFQ